MTTTRSGTRTRTGDLTLAKRVKAARQARGLPRRTLSQMIGRHAEYIGDLETGIHATNSDSLRRLAFVLKVSADYLLGLDHHRTPEDFE